MSDLVVTGIPISGYGGSEMIRDIKKRYLNIKELVITKHIPVEYNHTLVKAGTHGYILKDNDQEVLGTPATEANNWSEITTRTSPSIYRSA